MSPQHVPDRARTTRAIELVVAAAGVALVVAAVLANQRWLDRHFLPSWFIPHRWYGVIESSVRVAFAIVGAWLVLYVRPRIGRSVAAAPIRALSIAIAAVLAIAAGEFVLSHVHLPATEWLLSREEPLRQADPRLGWVFVPSRTGHARIGGRTIDYSFDAAGYRVRQPGQSADLSQPAIVCVGESVMFGEGLTWEESIPAQIGSLAGIQSVNVAVHGYATDQMYLRLEAELPRFQRPVAVVALFMTALFGRNLDSDRPHLGPGLEWLPAEQHGRLRSLAALIVPYRTDRTVERGVAMTRDALAGIVRLARARAATPLVVVPHFGAEDDADRNLRLRVLDEANVPYVWVGIDDAWRLAWDRHPNAAAAHEIAVAVAERLRQSQ